MTLIRKVSLGEWRYLTSLLSVFACAPLVFVLVFVIVVCAFLLLFVHAIFPSSFSFYISCLEILSECQTNHCLHCHHHHYCYDHGCHDDHHHDDHHDYHLDCQVEEMAVAVDFYPHCHHDRDLLMII